MTTSWHSYRKWDDNLEPDGYILVVIERDNAHDSTIERTVSGLAVKDAGITSAKVSAGLAARVGGEFDDIGEWDSTGETGFECAAANMVVSGADITDGDLAMTGHEVFLDGQLMRLGGDDDYTIAHDGSGSRLKITFNSATPNPSYVQLRLKRTGITA